jgi:hypothetical protein
MITESTIHQLIGDYTLKFLRTPKHIVINSEHYVQLPETLKNKFAGLFELSYFLPYNHLEAL